MNNIKSDKLKSRFFNFIIAFGIGVLFLCNSCEESILNETPLSSLSPDKVLTTKDGFELFITSLHQAARDELTIEDLSTYFDMSIGTDIATTGQEPAVNYRNYGTYLIPTNPTILRYWDWAYKNMLLRANTIIVYANKPELKNIWSSESEKNAIIAEARFFRAYTHNFLANLYGGVPIIDTIYAAPKTDFVKNTRAEVYKFASEDLEFASKWLPETVVKAKEGRIVKAAADHLLSEVYVSLGEYDKAIASASKVIDSGLYKLMNNRFGVDKDKPGDVYSDLFKTGNQNRSNGNLETIYNWQFEDKTPGGQGTLFWGNHILRGWGPFLVNLKDPSGKTGMILVDSIGRGVGWVRPNTYFLYNLWKDNWNNDIRNSKYSIRRTHYYNNPASSYFKKPVEKRAALEDTMQNSYPTLRKIEGKIVYNAAGGSYGYTCSDFIVYRLAGTYLLRAEAYLRKGNLQNAADDLNAIRSRAHASLIAPGEVSIDYILDERARELIVEEPRRRTLMRMGKLVERVKKYNMRESTRNTILPKHELWPIPQAVIDANFSAKLEQNPEY
jgi:starch-binding outer membrane protein, SusD/RagB family